MFLEMKGVNDYRYICHVYDEGSILGVNRPRVKKDEYGGKRTYIDQYFVQEGFVGLARDLIEAYVGRKDVTSETKQDLRYLLAPLCAWGLNGKESFVNHPHLDVDRLSATEEDVRLAKVLKQFLRKKGYSVEKHKQTPYEIDMYVEGLRKQAGELPESKPKKRYRGKKKSWSIKGTFDQSPK